MIMVCNEKWSIGPSYLLDILASLLQVRVGWWKIISVILLSVWNCKPCIWTKGNIFLNQIIRFNKLVIIFLSTITCKFHGVGFYVVFDTTNLVSINAFRYAYWRLNCAEIFALIQLQRKILKKLVLLCMALPFSFLREERIIHIPVEYNIIYPSTQTTRKVSLLFYINYLWTNFKISVTYCIWLG